MTVEEMSCAVPSRGAFRRTTLRIEKSDPFEDEEANGNLSWFLSPGLSLFPSLFMLMLSRELSSPHIFRWRIEKAD